MKLLQVSNPHPLVPHFRPPSSCRYCGHLIRFERSRLLPHRWILLNPGGSTHRCLVEDPNVVSRLSSAARRRSQS